MIIASSENIKKYSNHDQVISVMQNLSLLSFFPYLLGLYGNEDLSIHSNKVAEIALTIIQVLGSTKEEQQKIYLAGLLHDTGKLGIPWSILKKKEKLDTQEFEIMKSHTLIGYELLKDLSFDNLFELSVVARDHHEKLNHTGYPFGKGDKELSLNTKIITIADIYEALTAKRIYKASYSPEKALIILEEHASKGNIDKDILEILKDITKNNTKPDLSVLQIQKPLENFNTLSSIYRNEIIHLLEKIINYSPHGYNTVRLREITKRIASLCKLSQLEYQQLELATLIGGVGTLCLPESNAKEEISVEKILENRRIILKESVKLLSISPWFTEIIPILKYVFAYYNGDPQRSIYLGEFKSGENIPLLSRILAIVITIANIDNNFKERLQHLSGKYYDPEIVKLILENL